MNNAYREFILRRLHSMTGMLPMGLFLFEHFFTNSYSHQGAESFNHKADILRTLPYIYFIEIFALGAPFLFHIVYGLKIIYSGEVNVLTQSHARNFMYFLQRLTAIPALGFIVFHIITVRLTHGHEPDLYAVMADAFSNPLIVAFYVIGVVSVVFHFANGAATFCITWGITVSPLSQRLVGYACAIMGVTLGAMALWSIFGFNDAGRLDGAAQAMSELPVLASRLMAAMG